MIVRKGTLTANESMRLAAIIKDWKPDKTVEFAGLKGFGYCQVSVSVDENELLYLPPCGGTAPVDGAKEARGNGELRVISRSCAASWAGVTTVSGELRG